MQKNASYQERPIRILDRSIKRLRNKEVTLVKVVWDHHGDSEASWELESEIRDKYPQLFEDQGTNSEDGIPNKEGRM